MKRTSLTVLLPAVFFFTIILFLGGYSTFVLSNMRTALVDQAVANLDLASERGGKRVEDWFGDTERTLMSTAEAKQTRDSIAQLSAILRGAGPDAAGFLNETYVAPNTAVGTVRDEFDYSSDRSAYGQSHARIHDHFRTLRRTNGYYDVFLFDTSGMLLYTVTKEPDLGLNALSGPLSETTLGTAFRQALEAPTPTVMFTDFAPYTYSGGAPAGFMAVQVRNDRGDTVGVLAIQLPVDVLTQIVRDSDLDGRAFRFTLLGSDGRLRMDGDTGTVLQSQGSTPQVEAALRGETGVLSDTVSVDGTPVLAAFRPVAVLGSQWSLVTELDWAGVMAPVWKEMRLAIVAVLVLGLAAIGAGVLIGRWIARPLAQLTDATARLMAREEVTIDHLTRRDEVGELARGLERFRLDRLAAAAHRREMIFKGKAFDTTRTAMMIADAEGTLLYVNDALTKLFRSNIKSMQSRYPTMNVDRLVGTNISIFHSNHGRVMNLLRDPKSGQIAPDVQVGADTYALSVSAVDEPDGTRAGYVVVWEDVRELRRVKAVMSAVDAGQVILEVDPEGRVLRINAQGTGVYGYTQDQIVGQPLAILFKNGAAEANSVLKRVLADGSLTEFHHRVARDGTDRFVICNFNVVRDGRGNAERIVAICTDQTRDTLYRRSAESQTEARNRDLAVVVNGLRDTLGGMAQGDLSRTIDSPFPPEYESLRQNCNQAILGLSAALQQVSAVADGILSGADDISNAASDLSRRTESQAATLEQTAAALDSLTSSVRNATEGTLKAGQRVTSAHSEAHANGSVVRKAIDAMTAIETSSNQISKIISVIDDIAFQTNLLALNAGVEAARAGDAGRGFAVVAAEVRALAQRSSEAAREIKTLISTSEAQVVTGAELVNQSGRAVEAIVGDVAEISRLVNTISQSSQDQANGLAEINAGVMVLDKVTQQNAVMVEQSTAASAALKHEVDALTGLLAGFKLVDGSGSGRVRRKASHAA